MKKVNLKLFLIIALLTIAAPISFSQIKLQVGPGIGYSAPLGNMAGSTIDYYNGIKYGLSSGYNVHGKIRAGLIGFNLFGEISYGSFSGDGESEPGQGKVEVSQKIFSLKAGPEFSFGVPLAPVNPYIQVFVAYNNISGEVDFTGVARVPSGNYKFDAQSRFGAGAGAGVEISLGMLMRLDLNLQYNIYNLAGKNYKTVDPLDQERIDAYSNLNDDQDPQYNPNSNVNIIGDSRVLSGLEIKATLMFGI